MIAKLQSNNFRCFFPHFYYLLHCSNVIFVKKSFTYEFQLIYASHGHTASSYKNLTKIFFSSWWNNQNICYRGTSGRKVTIMIETFLCCRKTKKVMHNLIFLYLKRKNFFYGCGEVRYAAMQMSYSSNSISSPFIARWRMRSYYDFQLIHASYSHTNISYKTLTEIFFLLDETTKINAKGELVEGKVTIMIRIFKKEDFFYNYGEVWYAAMQMKMASLLYNKVTDKVMGSSSHVWLEKKKKKRVKYAVVWNGCRFMLWFVFLWLYC